VNAHSPTVLQYIVCGALPAASVDEPIRALMAAGWDVRVVCTGNALRFVDQAVLAELTGHAVEFEYRAPDMPKVSPDPDAVVVAPATFNTINKVVYGIADTLAVSRICEAVGAGTPVLIAPCLSPGLRHHPAYTGHPPQLESWGVSVIDGVFQDVGAEADWGRLLSVIPGPRDLDNEASA
jgi:phosphopantothenoylcysteine synthetase/decarboxylase